MCPSGCPCTLTVIPLYPAVPFRALTTSAKVIHCAVIAAAAVNKDRRSTVTKTPVEKLPGHRSKLPTPSTSRDYTEVRQEAIVGEKIIYLNEQTKKRIHFVDY